MIYSGRITIFIRNRKHKINNTRLLVGTIVIDKHMG